MPRANKHFIPGFVRRPSEWSYCGYEEIQNPRQRYRLIDHSALIALCGMKDSVQLREAHRHWVENILSSQHGHREPHCTESIAVGSESFVEKTKTKPGIGFKNRKISNENDDQYSLREPLVPYNADFNTQNGLLSINNSYK